MENGSRGGGNLTGLNGDLDLKSGGGVFISGGMLWNILSVGYFWGRYHGSGGRDREKSGIDDTYLENLHGIRLNEMGG